jgi:hypothetical protein
LTQPVQEQGGLTLQRWKISNWHHPQFDVVGVKQPERTKADAWKKGILCGVSSSDDICRLTEAGIAEVTGRQKKRFRIGKGDGE